MNALALFLSMLLLSETGPVQPVPANQNAILAWDAPTTNADGTPCDDLAGYVVAISDPTVDLRQGGMPLLELEVKNPKITEQSVSPLVSGRPQTLYNLWVRAYDLAGNKSVWSAPLLARFDSVAPGGVGGPRIKVTVIVETGG